MADDKTEGPQEAVALSQTGATFAERAKARAAAEPKAVSGDDDAENKEVTSASTKKRTAKKS